jgi:ribonuclease Z
LKTWQGRNLEVKVLYSSPGIAQHIWIEHDFGALLLDVGDGVLRDLRSNRLDPKSIKGIIVTHGHFDHVGGLHSLLGFMRMIGREGALPIYIPSGCVEAEGIVNQFVGFYRETMPFDVKPIGVNAQDVFEVARFSVRAYPVVHSGGIAGHEVLEQIPALGYRLTYAGETVAVTGDTGMCASLAQLVKNSDLALIEATFADARGVSDEELQKVHLSEQAAKELGSLAKSYILVHRGGNH